MQSCSVRFVVSGDLSLFLDPLFFSFDVFREILLLFRSPASEVKRGQLSNRTIWRLQSHRSTVVTSSDGTLTAAQVWPTKFRTGAPRLLWNFETIVSEIVACKFFGNPCRRVHGATVARLTPDQTVGSSILSGLIFQSVAKDGLYGLMSFPKGNGVDGYDMRRVISLDVIYNDGHHII